MEQTFYPNEIIDWWKTQINTEIATGLGLVLVQKGFIEFYPGLEKIENDCPAIFMRYDDSSTDDIDSGVNLETIYNFTLVYVKKITLTAKVEEALITDVRTINEFFVKYLDMPGYSAANITILSAVLTNTNMNNIYNTVLGGIQGKSLRAVEMTLRVKTNSVRR